MYNFWWFVHKPQKWSKISLEDVYNTTALGYSALRVIEVAGGNSRTLWYLQYGALSDETVLTTYQVAGKFI